MGNLSNLITSGNVSVPPSAKVETIEPLPLSLLNDYLYCPRRAALKMVEGWRSANEHTARGDIVHEHADLPGYEVAKGVTLLRALPVFSEHLGLNGKCDIVEVHSTSKSSSSGRESAQAVFNPQPAILNEASQSRLTSAATFKQDCTLRPVEFKLGKRRQWENDDVQLCAQALCLEEMFGVIIPCGAVFHAQSKRRREVDFNADLRARTEQAGAELHALLSSESIPPARYVEGRCEECSLFEICLPRLTQAEAVSATAAAVRRLYQT